MYYHVDIDYLNQLPVHQLASQLGISFTKNNHCFCPDPSCPDHGSSHPAACINPQNNSIHCFVCGNTWRPFALTGLVEFQMDQKECYTRDGIQRIGEYLGSVLGYGGLKPLEKEEDISRPPGMPQVIFHTPGGTNKYPLYIRLGLKSNPLASVHCHGAGLSQSSKEPALAYKIPVSQGAWLLFQKGLECLYETYGLLHTLLEM